MNSILKSNSKKVSQKESKVGGAKAINLFLRYVKQEKPLGLKGKNPSFKE